jgi:diaminohydroxyphosphoribosylaminopyrimidine deaminase / 5-amino-6-(5-phosphoribosylamino)uracil reductase
VLAYKLPQVRVDGKARSNALSNGLGMMDTHAATALREDAPDNNILATAPQRVILPFQRPAEIDTWSKALAARHGGPMPAEWVKLFGPIIEGGRSATFIVGQLGQSLDGRIATQTGHSKYINGEPGLRHLHRLRALCDGVIVGVGTAVADDPMLTVRLCEGDSPARIVIDPRGRMPISAKLLRDDGARRIIITAHDTSVSVASDVEIIRLRRGVDGRLSPHEIKSALGDVGLRRLLLEGGSHTISGFVAAGAMDRLHMLVAPMIVGSGQAGLALPPINLIDEALRPPTMAHLVGNEVIFDCDLSSA